MSRVPRAGDEPPITKELENLIHPVREVDEAWVEVVRGPDQGLRSRVTSRLFRIGSDPLSDLVLTDPTASRRHCEVEVSRAGFKLQDVGSTNGTFVDELRLGEIFLDDGVQFSVGNSVLVFHTVGAEAELPEPPATLSGRLVGRGPAVRALFEQILKVAPTDLSVIIEGETGTGKELVASAIHAHSARSREPFIVFDCSAFPPTLIESELFGHERGAFSGAVGVHKGVFERADGGTIFFDELGEMDVEFQAKFLRALESGEVRRVGGERTFRVNVRVIAATNRSLEDMIKAGTFRQDLFYRFAKMRLFLPPLRERLEDIPMLVSHFLHQLTGGGPDAPVLTSSGLEVLYAYPWPGNVRELRNIVERAAALCEGGRITGEFLRRELGLEAVLRERRRSGAHNPSEAHADLLPDADETVPLRDAKERIIADFERRYLERLLAKHEQNISRAAREAQVDRRHFYRLLKKHGMNDGQGNEG
jgi:DNA-binding NtrC family response regulator